MTCLSKELHRSNWGEESTTMASLNVTEKREFLQTQILAHEAGITVYTGLVRNEAKNLALIEHCINAFTNAADGPAVTDQLAEIMIAELLKDESPLVRTVIGQLAHSYRDLKEAEGGLASLPLPQP